LKRVELNGNKFMEDDANIEELRVLLEKRQEELGTDEDAEDAWGLDELDELEEEEEEEEEEQEEEEEEEEVRTHLADKTLKETIRAEDEPVSQKKDDDVDALADALGKTGI
jgi:Ran GTPase-activating protein 1